MPLPYFLKRKGYYKHHGVVIYFIGQTTDFAHTYMSWLIEVLLNMYTRTFKTGILVNSKCPMWIVWFSATNHLNITDPSAIHNGRMPFKFLNKGVPPSCSNLLWTNLHAPPFVPMIHILLFPCGTLCTPHPMPYPQCPTTTFWLLYKQRDVIYWQ